MTSIARYTPNQQDLINEFRAKDVSNIAIKQKAPTTTLIKSIVKKKDQQILEELLPKFIEYYDTNRSKSDKSTFESKFLKTLKNAEDQQFFETIYKKDNGAELEDNIIKVKVNANHKLMLKNMTYSKKQINQKLMLKNMIYSNHQ